MMPLVFTTNLVYMYVQGYFCMGIVHEKRATT